MLIQNKFICIILMQLQYLHNKSWSCILLNLLRIDMNWNLNLKYIFIHILRLKLIYQHKPRLNYIQLWQTFHICNLIFLKMYTSKLYILNQPIHRVKHILIMTQIELDSNHQDIQYSYYKRSYLFHHNLYTINLWKDHILIECMMQLVHWDNIYKLNYTNHTYPYNLLLIPNLNIYSNLDLQATNHNLILHRKQLDQLNYIKPQLIIGSNKKELMKSQRTFKNSYQCFKKKNLKI
ncbi:unnamed protein product [Paramecium primaurelia]|uniref:Uncharacterized protein n=1 Tax=Paramecium primaurelia TaxID=5886 RepID=A0A8S1N686_PARPR|nr:unnamed protein product [Paramecium primaurelia]